jgi:hypothetical protein
MVHRIALSGARGAGRVALVDDADAALVAGHSWHLDSGGYARAGIGGREVRLHSLITGQRGVDHANGDPLDCQRHNLRPATQGQNNANARPIGGASPYKGVSRNRAKWMALIQVAGRRRYLGSYATPEEAARAYDVAALEAWGRFARPNGV